MGTRKNGFPCVTIAKKHRRKALIRDEYYCHNLSRSITMLPELLQISNGKLDVILNFKRSKTNIRRGLDAKEPPVRKGECKCRSTENNKQSSFIQYFYKQLAYFDPGLPSLRRIELAPKQTICFPSKLLIINADGILIARDYANSNTYMLRPKMASTLVELQSQYQTVLIYSETTSEINLLIRYLFVRGVVFSGIYQYTPSDTVKNILDYSQVYRDFGISSLEMDTLVISALLLPQEEIDSRSSTDLVAFKHGLYPHPVIQNIPFHSSPTLAIPALASPTLSFSLLIKLFQSSDFSTLASHSELLHLPCSLPLQYILQKSLNIPSLTISRIYRSSTKNFCPVHLRPTLPVTPLPLQDFLIVKPSAFQSHITPVIQKGK